MLYSEYQNEECIEKIKKQIPLYKMGDIVKIGGPRPVISRRGNKAELIEFIKIDTTFPSEIWKVKFIKNGEEKQHAMYYSPLT